MTTHPNDVNPMSARGRLGRTLTTVPGLLALATLLGGSSCSSIDDELQQAFLDKLGRGVTLSVYPAVVRRSDGQQHDPAAAERIAGLLVERGLALATVGEAEVPLPTEPGRYQLDVWRASAKAFGEWVVAHPAPGEYALLPEYLIGRDPRGNDFAGGIHAFVVDRQGRLVEGFLLNSHHQAFRDAKATTADQCTAVLLGEIERAWVDEGQR